MMGTKQQPGDFDCYAKALPDEPMFVLLARDPDAPALIEQWAIVRMNLISEGKRPDSDRAMVEEARKCANSMRRWRIENNGKWRSEPQPAATEREDQRMQEDMTLAYNARKSAIEECARVADALADHEQTVFDRAKTDAAMSESGRHSVMDRASARQAAAQSIARTIRALAQPRSEGRS